MGFKYYFVSLPWRWNIAKKIPIAFNDGIFHGWKGKLGSLTQIGVVEIAVEKELKEKKQGCIDNHALPQNPRLEPNMNSLSSCLSETHTKNLMEKGYIFSSSEISSLQYSKI